MQLPLAIGWPGPVEMVIIAILGLLIFGRRLPEVARSVGKSIVEFKKGMSDIGHEVNGADSATTTVVAPPLQQPAARAQLAAPHKFDPYTGKPIEDAAPAGQSSLPPQGSA